MSKKARDIVHNMAISCKNTGDSVTDKPKATGDVYCWHNSDTSLGTNQSCLTGQSHPAYMMSSSTNITEDTVNNTTGNTTTPAPSTTVMRCLTYTNDTTLRYHQNIMGTLVDTWRSCDFDGVCDNRTLNKSVRATINGSDVLLLCCEGNNCNSLVQLPVSTPVATPTSNNSHCYQLTMEGSDMKLRGCKTACHTEDMRCVKDTLYLKSGIMSQMYNCDIENKCANINESEPVCKNYTTGANNTREVCCCKGDYCVKPDQTYDEPKKEDMNSACSVLPINSTNHHPPGTPSPKKTNWLFVGGVIASAAVAILLALLVVIVIMRVKRQAKQNNRLTLSYTRLSADRVPDDDEDVQMLLS
ncbi:hypothetical protein KP79_PYT16941 [Mizuhopecten yessoensis]|uniref:Uncharacterized protein n=1 Tax=Mizuhopecten yessoensis TaxID=6573 RepID=A0A210QKJ8_MIZYE|nr:hypothetical protein KP79_PYT16941 [Mizuhopecten yessoensis]